MVRLEETALTPKKLFQNTSQIVIHQMCVLLKILYSIFESKDLLKLQLLIGVGYVVTELIILKSLFWEVSKLDQALAREDCGVRSIGE